MLSYASVTTSHPGSIWRLVWRLAGCTISLLDLAMDMEVIIRASKWVVGDERLQDATRLPPLRAYKVDMTTLTTTAPCTRWLLAKLNDLNEMGKDVSET